MNFEHLFIVTYGRTGSTLLMGVLNSIENVIIRGENLNVCKGIFDSYSTLCKLKKDYGNEVKSVTKPFFGAHLSSEEKFLIDARTLIKNQLDISKDNVCWGFKEVRYTTKDLTDENGYIIKKYLDFMNKLFPNALFVFLIRDFSEVSKSGFWEGVEKVRLEKIIKDFEDDCVFWSKNKPNSYWLDYADIVHMNQKFRDLFDLLGVEFKEENIKKVLIAEHSYANKKIFPVLKVSVDPVVSPSIISGIVLIHEKLCIDDYELLIKGSDDISVEWGIESPFLHKKYPGNANSFSARFRIDLKNTKIQNECILYLKNKVLNEEFEIKKIII